MAQSQQQTPAPASRGSSQKDLIDELKEWVRQELELMMAGVPREDREERNP